MHRPTARCSVAQCRTGGLASFQERANHRKNHSDSGTSWEGSRRAEPGPAKLGRDHNLDLRPAAARSPSGIIERANPSCEGAPAAEDMSFEEAAGCSGPDGAMFFYRDRACRSDFAHQQHESLSAERMHAKSSRTQEDHGGEAAEDGY